MRRRSRAASLVLVPVLMLGSALTLTSCAGADQQGSAAHRMSVWVSGTDFGGDIGTLIADNARVPKDVANGTGAVHAACSTLLNDAQMAYAELPSPDPDVTQLLNSAYTLEQAAANDCYIAGTTDTKLLTKAEHEGIKAEALYNQALQRIRQIDGRAVPTTTTTDNSSGGIFG
jgi:hypothetical protein